MQGLALSTREISPSADALTAVRRGPLLAVVGDRNKQPMHPDDLQRILDALDRSNQPATNPLVAAMNGADAEVLRRFVSTEVEKTLAPVLRKLESFLPDSEIERRLVAKFERIGLRVDDDHYEETGEAIRGFMKWHKRADKVLGGIAISILGAVVLALLKMVGINVPSVGSG